MSSGGNGTVKYPHYKPEHKGVGPKNKRKNKLSKRRNEDAFIDRLRKLKVERIRNLEKARYAKEAREWETRYDYL